ncbi:MAG TPA: SDR family oxidoreductase [Gemmatimonadaceae bacterium]|jgi:NAD(P)-dependent dehydrogenase (short-subunit alcohol dehydrogenase family)|nr:SDR family oxidoreductase [Gemmatimonadaceae bacterium]
MTATIERPLAGRVIVITGGAGLIGPHHAAAVTAAGGTAVLLDVRVGSLALAVEKARREPEAQVEGAVCDITDESAVEALADDLTKRFGGIDGLVNNAARNPKVEAGNESAFSRFEQFPQAQWSADIAVGLTGAFICAKVFGRAMAARGAGSIVNISSEYGRLGPDQRLYEIPGVPAAQQPAKPVSYTVVKAGLHGLTLYLATYWAAAGVRVNTLVLGGVENAQPADFLERAASRIPMARMARPDEFGGALVYLLSDAASFVTGSELVVDGGKSAW